MLGRIAYRIRQFGNALFGRLTAGELETASRVLSPAQFELFCRLQPSEQIHSMEVYRKLLEQGETNPDLLTAALLHDVGKNRFSLRLWERVLVVLAKRLVPDRASMWGKSWAERKGRWWQRSFAIALYHPAWGAEMAARAGSPPLTVRLIQRHQDRIGEPAQDHTEDRLLRVLQAVDDDS